MSVRFPGYLERPIEPAQPRDYPFLDSWRQPLHAEPLRWERMQPQRGEADLRRGVRIINEFPDVDGVLSFAWSDFNRFLESAGLAAGRGAYPMRVGRRRLPCPEAWQVTVTPTACLLEAHDAEGVRRGLVHIEDAMLGCEGPFLPLGRVRRVPVIRRRIAYDTKLFQHVGLDIPPDAYLNRLAHNGVNGLFLPFSRVYSGRIVPEFSVDPEEAIAHCRERIRRYARYGIRLYLYLNEPRAFPPGSPWPKAHPGLAGHVFGGGTCYCTGSAEGRTLMERAFARLVGALPGLGGVVVICAAEVPTHCYWLWADPSKPVHCPRCTRLGPQRVLRETLAAMRRGIRRGNREAEFVAWPYFQHVYWGEQATVASAGCVPPGTILMHNFESGGRARQLGRLRRADDYWLSYPGPSALFEACARRARRGGTPVYAKTVTGCSHELASVPYIPVPGNVYRKFKAMQGLGVSGVLLNWKSGNEPSLMNRAAGRLAFTPLPETEQAFLEELARPLWGRHARVAARAWGHFRRAYAHVPLTIGFSYHGPLHDGPVWPLFLDPRDLSLGRNWAADPSGGDRIGECLGEHGLDEALALCTRLRDGWRRGLAVLAPLEAVAADHPERMRDLAVARALQLHFESAVSILRFYALRERVAWGPREEAPDRLREMRAVVRAELTVDRRLLELVARFPRLGFCPEACIYRYHAEKIRWRMRQIEQVLAVEFPRVARRLRRGGPAFPQYTGQAPQGFVYRCPPGTPGRAAAPTLALHVFQPGRRRERPTAWRAVHDRHALYFVFDCAEPHPSHPVARAPDRGDVSGDDHVQVIIQTTPFAPFQRYFVNAAGAREFSLRHALAVLPVRGAEEYPRWSAQDGFYRWSARVTQHAGGWRAVLRLPFRVLGFDPRRPLPFRFNLARLAGPPEDREGQCLLPPRNGRYIERDPAHMGWILLEAGAGGEGS